MLGICKVLSLGCNNWWGGLSKKKWLGVAHLFLWKFSILSILKLEKSFSDPGTQQNRWMADISCDYCKTYKLNHTGDALTLRQQVEDHIARKNFVSDIGTITQKKYSILEHISISVRGTMLNWLSESVNDDIISKVDYCVNIFWPNLMNDIV